MFQINTITGAIDNFDIIQSTDDILTFLQANVVLLHSLFKSNISEILVGFNDPSNWCDYMKIKREKPAAFKFVTNKLQLTDAAVSDVTQFLIKQCNEHKLRVDPGKISFITDFVCNIYLNQFDLKLKKSLS